MFADSAGHGGDTGDGGKLLACTVGEAIIVASLDVPPRAQSL